MLSQSLRQDIAIMSSMFVVVFIFENSIIIDEFNVKFHTKITCIIDALRVRILNNFITSIQISSDRVKVLIVITIVLNESIARDYLDNLAKDVNVERTKTMVETKILNDCFNRWRRHIAKVIEVLGDLV